jgi:hypothetical protein
MKDEKVLPFEAAVRIAEAVKGYGYTVRGFETLGCDELRLLLHCPNLKGQRRAAFSCCESELDAEVG